MKRHVTSLVAAVALVDGALPAVRATPPASVKCEIVADVRGGQARLSAWIESSVAVEGTYRFRAARTSAGNVSNVSQSAGFVAAPGEPHRVGDVVLQGFGGIDAALEIHWPGGDASCSRRLELP